MRFPKDRLSLVLFTGWYPVVACHQRNLGFHERTYLGDLIAVAVTFDKNCHQTCPNRKISWNVASYFQLQQSSIDTWWQARELKEGHWKVQ